jgi:hypothetical protein
MMICSGGNLDPMISVYQASPIWSTTQNGVCFFRYFQALHQLVIYSISYQSGLNLLMGLFNLVSGSSTTWAVNESSSSILWSQRLMTEVLPSIVALYSPGTVNGETTPTANWLLQSVFAKCWSLFIIHHQRLDFLSNTNYTLSGGLVSATIDQNHSILWSQRLMSGSTTFNSGFVFTGTVNGDSTPNVISGQATVSSKNAGLYTSFTTNGLTLSNSNYTLSGGLVSAQINKANATVTAHRVLPNLTEPQSL